MISSPNNQLARGFEDKDFRRRFLREFLSTGLAYQIRATRRDRGLTQAQLGSAIEGGMAQEYVSKLENPDTQVNVATAERIADAFDCALVMRLVPYSLLLDWATNLTDEDLVVPSFDEDAGPWRSINALNIAAAVDRLPMTTGYPVNAASHTTDVSSVIPMLPTKRESEWVVGARTVA